MYDVYLRCLRDSWRGVSFRNELGNIEIGMREGTYVPPPQESRGLAGSVTVCLRGLLKMGMFSAGFPDPGQATVCSVTLPLLGEERQICKQNRYMGGASYGGASYPCIYVCIFTLSLPQYWAMIRQGGMRSMINHQPYIPQYIDSCNGNSFFPGPYSNIYVLPCNSFAPATHANCDRYDTMFPTI